MTHVILMDIARCINCRSCEVACEREHAGFGNMTVQVFDERYAVPMSCRHCQDGPCIRVCPTNALHRETNDAVTIAPMKCIGCQLCMIACPFGIIKFDYLNKIARKCDLCVARTMQGLQPACVSTCSARALVYGEFDELKQTVERDRSRLLVVRSSGETGTLVRVPIVWSDPYR